MPPPTENPLRLSVRAADARIELAADQVTRRCLAALDLTEIPLPVPIEEWIEHPLGFRLNIVAAEDMEQGVLGLARPTEGEIELCDTLAEHEGRYRFTCAHELGHLILHSDRAAAFRDGALPSPASADDIEREADRFAAAVLMPVATLADAIERIRREQGLNPAVLPMLRGDDALSVWLWRRSFLPALCDRYGVSRAAMSYRLREVRLPGQKRLLRPSLAPLLVVPEKAIAALGLDRVRVVEGVPVPPA
jgi:hypothetical protein